MASSVFLGVWVRSLGPTFGQPSATQSPRVLAFLFLSLRVCVRGTLCVGEKNTREGSFPEGDQVHSSAK